MDGDKKVNVGAAPIKCLGDWLAQVEAIGELKRISAPVDSDLEMGSITYMNGKTIGGPTLLFENIKGYPGGRLLFNPYGSSLNRVAISIREALGKSPIEYTQILAEKMKRRIPPTFVDPKDAPVNQNIDRDGAVNVNKFPAPKMWPRDGGKYIGTADSVITSDANTGRVNMGTYRQMIKSDTEVGFYASPGKDAVLDRETWWVQGKPAPVAAVYGQDPLLFLTSATSFPKDVSEYEFAGGINGAPIEVFKSDVTGLTLPANAEIIIEGEVLPGEMADEGPFGESAGYMSDVAPKPVARITAITHRRDAIFYGLASQMPPSESTTLQSLSNAGLILKTLRHDHGESTVRDCWIDLMFGGGAAHLVVAMRPIRPGHAQDVGRLLAQTTSLKRITIVDEDIDIRNQTELDWVMSSHVDPARDVQILGGFPAAMDHAVTPDAQGRKLGSKLVIDATRSLATGPISLPSAALMARARGTWESAGLPATELSQRLRNCLSGN